MAVLTLTVDYQSFTTTLSKSENSSPIYVGGTNKFGIYRSCYRFDLTSLPAGAIVSQVRLKLNITTVGGAAGVWDVHAYNTTGQTDPSADAAATQYTRDASGNLYLDDDVTWRAVSNTWIILGGTVNTDVQNAKVAGTVYALGVHEEGDNDGPPWADGATTKPQLEITYTTGGGVTIKKGSNLAATVTEMLNSKMLFSFCNRFPKLTTRRF